MIQSLQNVWVHFVVAVGLLNGILNSGNKEAWFRSKIIIPQALDTSGLPTDTTYLLEILATGMAADSDRTHQVRINSINVGEFDHIRGKGEP